MSLRPPIALLVLMSGASFAGSPGDSLYARLGGHSKVTAFVTRTIEQATANPRVRTSIADADHSRLRRSWSARICALSGGGCAEERATPAIPAAAIEELRRAMRAQDVPLAARNELLDLLASP